MMDEIVGGTIPVIDMNRVVYPPLLRHGDTVGVIAPSLPLARHFPDRFEYGLAALRETQSVEAIVAPISRRSYEGILTGPARERAEAFNYFVRERKVRAIFCAIGGFNTTDMLPYIDFDAAREDPKLLIGYSDCTALLTAMLSRAGWVTFLGPMVMTQFGEFPRPYAYTLNSLHEAVRSPVEAYKVTDPKQWTAERLEWGTGEWRSRPRRVEDATGFSLWKPGRSPSATGSLWGGNIETLNFLVGTPYLAIPPRIILVWEATAEEAFLPRIRRALTHLNQSGILRRTEAMLIGRCPDAQPMWNTDLKETVLSATIDYDFAIMADLPLGHTDPMATIPIGAWAEVRTVDRTIVVHKHPEPGGVTSRDTSVGDRPHRWRYSGDPLEEDG